MSETKTPLATYLGLTPRQMWLGINAIVRQHEKILDTTSYKEEVSSVLEAIHTAALETSTPEEIKEALNSSDELAKIRSRSKFKVEAP